MALVCRGFIDYIKLYLQIVTTLSKLVSCAQDFPILYDYDRCFALENWQASCPFNLAQMAQTLRMYFTNKTNDDNGNLYSHNNV